MKKTTLYIVFLLFSSCFQIFGQTLTQKLYFGLGKDDGTYIANTNAMKVEELELHERTTSISVTGNNITACGQNSQMSIIATPVNSFYPAATWSVDNEEIAQISNTGKLSPKQNGTVTVTATITFNDLITVSASKEITISNQGIGEYSLAIMGSSVPSGTGAETGKGYAQLLAQWLARSAAHEWNTVNISIGGNNTTDVLNRWESDLLTKCTRYVYYGLSLGNEGIHEKGQAAFDSYRDNMQILINKAREAGKIPVIGNNYPRADFNATDYEYVKKLNMLIHEWDIPSVNLLGSIDDGNGKWVKTYEADNAHPNTIGHAEMFYVFVPSLFDALTLGKPQPVRSKNTSITLKKNNKVKQITWTPENVVHSFTLSFAFRSTSTGIIASFTNSNNSTSLLRINDEGKLVYETHSILNKLISSTAFNDGEWHQVSLSHHYALGQTYLYVDGVLVKNTTFGESLIPIRFHLNSFEDTPKSIDFSNLFFHRSAMNADEIKALYEGKMLKSSLEIYAPLNGSAPTEDGILANLAQSLNTLTIETQDEMHHSHQ
ncbi:MAG: GDSL-type esterase/lipase family protein [Dysgonomonas sp.]